ncbi:MAG: hypothetical protein BWY71_02263 [Planctomycetes bacterium ADurb.Bin412]|nr:MAG: hypothetical protein BWY71_02263 [Planctomycetes bacterium ADurb.Bin412]
MVQLRAGNNLIHGIQTDLTGDCLGRNGIITGNHYDPNTGRITFLNSLGHCGADRIGKSDQTQEGELEIVLFLRQIGLGNRPALGHSQNPQAFTGH